MITLAVSELINYCHIESPKMQTLSTIAMSVIKKCMHRILEASLQLAKVDECTVIG